MAFAPSLVPYEPSDQLGTDCSYTIKVVRRLAGTTIHQAGNVAKAPSIAAAIAIHDAFTHLLAMVCHVLNQESFARGAPLDRSIHPPPRY
jgi:hypothetical protein